VHLKFHHYDQGFVGRVRGGGPDANGQKAEVTVSDGQGNPCRSCLHQISAGARMVVLAACPFPALQPCRDGGIFLCADSCVPFAGAGLPQVLTGSPQYLLKGLWGRSSYHLWHGGDCRLRRSGRICAHCFIAPGCGLC